MKKITIIALAMVLCCCMICATVATTNASATEANTCYYDADVVALDGEMPASMLADGEYEAEFTDGTVLTLVVDDGSWWYQG